jgi:hypothetical protein
MPVSNLDTGMPEDAAFAALRVFRRHRLYLEWVPTGNRTCRRQEATSSAGPRPVILLLMKFKLFIGTVAFAMLVLAVAGWAVDGLRWALPARA